MSNSQATPADGELILKLYNLRRETVMREARNFVLSFAPQKNEDILAIISDFSSKENAYMRQVIGYWNMAASLVLHGALNEALARDNFTEMLFVYAKIEPFLAKIRQGTGMETFAAHMQKFVEGSPDAQARVASLQQRFAAMRTEASKVGA